jgi:uncharacterized protein (DUF433 family)
MASTPRAPVPKRDEEPSGLALALRASLHRRIDELDEAQLREAARLLDHVQGSKPTRREQALIQRWIEPHPRGSYRARVVGAGVPVYAIVGQLGLESGTTDDQLAKVAENYQVPLEAARAALAYYRQHRFLIDAWLAMNAE